mmetsp:Transcript_1149/g.2309  ORF Transcript_1149/g.2309 Transcript_1149/m.2309 type:complete len:409 (-) Transcript_1149:983-2209(-)
MTKTRNQYSTSVYQSKAVVLAIMLALLSLALIPSAVTSFHIPPSRCSPILPTSAAPIDDRRFQRSVFLNAENTPMSEQELKERLTEYLAKRKEANADEAAQEIKGKVVGGTRNNVVLEYISGAPVKEKMIDRAPNVFDYDELSRYGYSNLVEPIMDMVGGRRAVYELMDMEPPPLVGPPKRKKVPKLKIDRTGEDDKARYTGLKMGQVLDDDMMAEALARANEKAKEGKELRPALMEESYVQPFADKRNTGPAQTPDWTPEQLDEYAKERGRAQDWARKAKLGAFVKDPSETSELSPEVRIYAIFNAVFFAFSFGRATPTFLAEVLHIGTTSSAQGLQSVLQIPALTLATAAVGSSVACAAVLAPERNRGAIMWGLKGFFGGPLTVLQLRQLDTLITREETDAAAKLK